MTFLTFKPGLKNRAIYTERTDELITPVDIVENDSAYVLEFDVPGFGKENINVAVIEGVLTVKGERKRTVETNEKYFRYFERPEGTFGRSFTLPGHVDVDALKASYANGVLRLEIPKKEEEKPHVIEIK